MRNWQFPETFIEGHSNMGRPGLGHPAPIKIRCELMLPGAAGRFLRRYAGEGHVHASVPVQHADSKD